MSNVLIWFPKSELDEWSDEAGTDYEDDNKKTSDEKDATSEEVSDEDEVQDGNANEDEVKVRGGGMPEMPTKMPAPEKMNDQGKWCANILAPCIV